MKRPHSREKLPQEYTLDNADSSDRADDEEDEDNDEQCEDEDHNDNVQGPEVPRSSFTDEELTILCNGKARWMSSKGARCKKFFRAMVKELRKLDGIKDLSAEQWNTREQKYRTWLYNQNRTGGGFSHIKIGNTWTMRSVIQQQYKAAINNTVVQKFGERGGTIGGLRVYQKALRHVERQLTEEQKNEAEETAARWNLERGPPDEVKARNAARHGQKVFRDFAMEMWRACGMRVVILAGWKDEKGEVVTAVGDFNEDINGGQSFAAIDEVASSWPEFIGSSFEGSGEAGTDSEISDDARVSKEMMRSKQKNPTALVTLEDGSIWVPDIESETRDGLQAIVRGFLTAKYRKACKRKTATTPFTKLPSYGPHMVASRHLPADFEFPNDPSHMKKADAIQFLQFIRDRQVSHPNDPFVFHHWLDDENNLQEAWETDESEDEEPRVQRSKAHKSRSKTPQKTGKHSTMGGNSRSGVGHHVPESSDEESEFPESSPQPTTPRHQKANVKRITVPLRLGSDDDDNPDHYSPIRRNRNGTPRPSRSPVTAAQGHERRSSIMQPKRHSRAQAEYAPDAVTSNAMAAQKNTRVPKNSGDPRKDSHGLQNAANIPGPSHSRNTSSSNPRPLKSALKKRSIIQEEEGPQNVASEGNSAQAASNGPSERRSTRARRTPAPADADFSIPEKRTPRKRKYAGTTEPSKKSKQ